MKRAAKDTLASARTISRRALILGGAQLTFMGGLGLRMRYLQVDQADQYLLLAEENRINLRLLAPARGLIYDRNGVVIADNEQIYRIVVVREDAGDLDETLAKISRLVALTADEIERARRELRRRSSFVPVTIADRLNWDEVAEVAVNAPALPGVTPEVGLSRYYPMGEDFAHLVGYVGAVSEKYLEQSGDDDPLLEIPKFQVGKRGAESELERTLRGSAGTRRIEVNAVGRVIRELDRIDGTAGAPVQMTVDSRLQNFVQARLAGQSAAAVVLDVETGDILAMGSAPSFDPNKFVRGISRADYRALLDNKFRPLPNKPVQGAYPPGSTYKMVTALAALEAGVVRPEETVYCPGFLEVGGRKFKCWKRGGHGNVNMEQSLKYSCDVYYYEMSLRVGIEKTSEMARRLGFGRRYDLPVSSISAGLTPTKDWKFARHGAEWLIGDSVNASIGQGYVLASPLQLAVMSARLATGRAITPRLIKSIGGVEQPVRDGEKLNINENMLRVVRKGMYAVSNETRGTAYRSRIIDEAMQMAGKTGTSQVSNALVNNKEVPWEQRDHALFVAFAPYDKPKYAVSVVVEHGGGGSTAAAPVARDIMLQAQYGQLPPLTAYPASQRSTIKARQDALQLRQIKPGSGRSRA
jgi:penicillin-binding protein 2